MRDKVEEEVSNVYLGEDSFSITKIAWVNINELDEEDNSFLKLNNWQVQDIETYRSGAGADLFSGYDPILRNHIFPPIIGLFPSEEPNYGTKSDILRLLIMGSQLKSHPNHKILYTDTDDLLKEEGIGYLNEGVDASSRFFIGADDGNSVLYASKCDDKFKLMLGDISKRLEQGYCKLKKSISKVEKMLYVQGHRSFKVFYPIHTTGPDVIETDSITRNRNICASSERTWFPKSAMNKREGDFSHLLGLSDGELVKRVAGSIYYDLILLKTNVFNILKYDYYLEQIKPSLPYPSRVKIVDQAWSFFRSTYGGDNEDIIDKVLVVNRDLPDPLLNVDVSAWRDYRYPGPGSIVNLFPDHSNRGSPCPPESKFSNELVGFEDKLKQEYQAWATVKWVKYNATKDISPDDRRKIKDIYHGIQPQQKMYGKKYKKLIITYLLMHGHFDVVKDIVGDTQYEQGLVNANVLGVNHMEKVLNYVGSFPAKKLLHYFDDNGVNLFEGLYCRMRDELTYLTSQKQFGCVDVSEIHLWHSDYETVTILADKKEFMLDVYYLTCSLDKPFLKAYLETQGIEKYAVTYVEDAMEGPCQIQLFHNEEQITNLMDFIQFFSERGEPVPVLSFIQPAPACSSTLFKAADKARSCCQYFTARCGGSAIKSRFNIEEQNSRRDYTASL